MGGDSDSGTRIPIMIRLIFRIFIRSSGLFLLVFILSKLDIRDIMNRLNNIHLIAVTPILMLFLALSYVKTIRWRLLLNRVNNRFGTGKLFSTYVGSFIIGALTPGRMGEIIKYRLLDRRLTDEIMALSISIQDRMWDFCLVLFLGISFIVYLTQFVVLIPIAFPILSLCLFLTIRPEKILSYIARMFAKHRNTERLIRVSKKMKPLSFSEMAKCLMLTVGSWIIYFTQVYLLFVATGLNFNILFISGTIAAAAVVALLPVSFAGIGTRDITLVGIFALGGKSPESAITLSACVLAVFIANCFISLPFWLYLTNTGDIE